MLFVDKLKELKLKLDKATLESIAYIFSEVVSTNSVQALIRDNREEAYNKGFNDGLKAVNLDADKQEKKELWKNVLLRQLSIDKGMLAITMADETVKAFEKTFETEADNSISDTPKEAYTPEDIKILNQIQASKYGIFQ